MAARMGDGVPGVKYASNGALHLGIAQGYGVTIAACGRACYGYSKKVTAEAITCKSCKMHM